MSSALATLLPSEAKVVREVLDDASAAVDSTAQQLADRVGVARSTVVRTCRKLGYEGIRSFAWPWPGDPGRAANGSGLRA
ncbi:hypothetical protein [Nesterenkonia pannonica]|uniref:hypothetical protein n=1 Tax=Nesterenkonia pannonica TaxID=1548602 RepID=UPI0021644B00|nr:hypothetical protein [Nesterenkonia pannonica]